MVHGGDDGWSWRWWGQINNNDSDGKKTTTTTMRTRRVLVAIGFWVQGLRCFPWMGVNFFLKDGLGVDPSTLQILLNSANLPMVAKPLFGLLSDSFCIFGHHRIPYIAFGAFLQAVSWLAIVFLSSSTISFFTITICLLLGNLGASVVEVANDAIVAEAGKQPTSDELQSFVWMASSLGGVLGNILGGVFVDRFSPRAMFFLFGVLLILQFFVTIFVSETSLELPNASSNRGIQKQLLELLVVLRRPVIARAITWFAISYAMIPSLTGTMFYYQTQHLRMESSVLGISKVFGQAAMLIWGIMYKRYLNSFQPRKLISGIQATMAVLMILDVLFVMGFNRKMGLEDSVYVVIFSGLLEVLYFFKILPFSILIAKLCPAGCEGSLMAFVMSSLALALIVSGYLGVALASWVGVTANNFSGLSRGLLLQAACTAVPLFWSSCIPHDVDLETKRKQN